MSQFVRHDLALLVGGDPVRDVEFLGFGVVKAGDLIGENVEHESIERKILGDQAKSFQGLFVVIALGVGSVFFFLADQILADFLFGAKALFKRLLDRQGQDLTHLREHFVGGFQEFRVGGCRDLSGRRRLGRSGDFRRCSLLSGHRQSQRKRE